MACDCFACMHGKPHLCAMKHARDKLGEPHPMHKEHHVNLLKELQEKHGYE
jgi:hypothetical protein